MRPRDARRTTSSIVAGVVAASLLASPLLTPSTALAQPSKDAVLFLYNEGKDLMEAGKYAEACVRFEKAQHLDPTAINLLLRLGDCYEKLGRTATAWTQFKKAADVAASAKDARVEAANDRARALEPKLSRLVLHLPPLSDARGLEVRLNGAVVARADFGRDAPVDPGSYAIEATAPGRKRWSVKQDVAPNGARVDVTIPPLEGAGVADTSLPSPPPAPIPDQGGLGVRRIIGITAGAMGLVGIGVGTAFGVKALSKNNQSNQGHCDADSFCDDAGYGLRKDAQEAGTISTIAFVAGAAFAAGGVVLLLTAPSAKRPASASARAFVVPTPGGGAIGLSGSF